MVTGGFGAKHKVLGRSIRFWGEGFSLPVDKHQLTSMSEEKKNSIWLHLPHS